MSQEPDVPEAYELTEHELSDGEEDAVKIGGEDEVEWMGKSNGHVHGVSI